MAELAIGIAGLAISIPGLIHVLGSMGDALMKKLGCYDDSDDCVRQMYLIIRLNKSQTQDMLSFINESEAAIPSDLMEELLQMFQTLRNIFERLLAALPGDARGVATQKGSKPTLSASERSKANVEVRKLEEWNDRFFKRALVFTLFGRGTRAIRDGEAALGPAGDEFETVEQSASAVAPAP